MDIQVTPEELQLPREVLELQELRKISAAAEKYPFPNISISKRGEAYIIEGSPTDAIYFALLVARGLYITSRGEDVSQIFTTKSLPTVSNLDQITSDSKSVIGLIMPYEEAMQKYEDLSHLYHVSLNHSVDIGSGKNIKTILEVPQSNSKSDNKTVKVRFFPRDLSDQTIGKTLRSTVETISQKIGKTVTTIQRTSV